MGYRSDLAWSCSKELYSQFKEALANADEQTRHDVEELLSCAEINHSGKKGWLVYFEAIKWYPDYTPVMFIEDFFKKADIYQYLFYRIGEDMDDTEAYGAWYDDPHGLYIFRHIDYFLPEDDDDDEKDA